MAIEYAMYRGDEFIDIGTIDELADKYYKRRELLAYLSKESTHDKNYGMFMAYTVLFYVVFSLNVY